MKVRLTVRDRRTGKRIPGPQFSLDGRVLDPEPDGESWVLTVARGRQAAIRITAVPYLGSSLEGAGRDTEGRAVVALLPRCPSESWLA